jgi:hypothetical protein
MHYDAAIPQDEAYFVPPRQRGARVFPIHMRDEKPVLHKPPAAAMVVPLRFAHLFKAFDFHVTHLPF